MPYQETLTVHTPRRGLFEITREVAEVVALSHDQTDSQTRPHVGLANVFVHHTSASLVIQENADPSAREDLERWFDAHVPDGTAFAHTAEGPDDMPAHIRTSITNTALTIPITDARLALGTWQGIYLFEHRTRPHTRRVTVTVLS